MTQNLPRLSVDCSTGKVREIPLQPQEQTQRDLDTQRGEQAVADLQLRLQLVDAAMLALAQVNQTTLDQTVTAARAAIAVIQADSNIPASTRTPLTALLSGLVDAVDRQYQWWFYLFHILGVDSDGSAQVKGS